jgi:membrane protein DedA with SNARE-associated domain
VPVAEWFSGAPFLIAFAALFGIVFARAQLTYWAARGLVAGAGRTRLADKLDDPKTLRITAALNRWGPPLITLSFLTVGIQTAVNAAAGLTRMSWLRYTAWMVPGCLAWAAIYATVGLAAAQAWIALAARWPWAQWIALAVVIAAIALGIVLRRRSLVRRTSPGVPDEVTR